MRPISRIMGKMVKEIRLLRFSHATQLSHPANSLMRLLPISLNTPLSLTWVIFRFVNPTFISDVENFFFSNNCICVPTFNLFANRKFVRHFNSAQCMSWRPNTVTIHDIDSLVLALRSQALHASEARKNDRDI